MNWKRGKGQNYSQGWDRARELSVYKRITPGGHFYLTASPFPYDNPSPPILFRHSFSTGHLWVWVGPQGS